MSTAPADLGPRVAELLAPPRGPAVADPVQWIEERLGERLWSAQAEIARSVAENRHTAVRSGHGVGKSHVASRLIAWFCSSFPVGEAFAVWTAPTGAQVESIVLRYLGQAHRRAGLPGRLTGGAVPAWKIHEETVAYGRKPQDLVDPEEAAAAFQGIHARHVLIVLDEAGGIPAWLWAAADSLMTSAGARVLAIGNPVDPTSKFAEVCAPGSGWHTIKISAFDTPAFTGEPVAPDVRDVLVSPEWVEDVRGRYGERSPFYIARVLAEFPEESEDGLISPTLVREAQERDLSGEALSDPGVLSIDVARGGDETVIYSVRGGMARLEHSSRGQDLMRTTGTVAGMLRTRGRARAVVDATGLGAGVYDRLREQGWDVSRFQGAERPRQRDRFANRRAEAFWKLREAFEAGRVDLDPDDRELARQLLELRWFENSRGLIQIESKDELRRRGHGSPDRADALSMAIATPRIAVLLPGDPALDPWPPGITDGVLTEPM